MGMKIGELAGRGGVNLQTIRYYERQGLLPIPPRLVSGYRVFPEDAVRRVRFIKRAQALGFSLGEIRDLLSIRSHTDGDAHEVRARANAKIADIEEKIRTLKAMKSALRHLTDKCSGCGPVSDCPILDAIEAHEVPA